MLMQTQPCSLGRLASFHSLIAQFQTSTLVRSPSLLAKRFIHCRLNWISDGICPNTRASSRDDTAEQTKEFLKFPGAVRWRRARSLRFGHAALLSLLSFGKPVGRPFQRRAQNKSMKRSHSAAFSFCSARRTIIPSKSAAVFLLCCASAKRRSDAAGCG